MRRGDPLNIENQFHRKKSENEDGGADDEREQRRPGLRPWRRWPRRARVVLQIRVAIDRDVFRGFKSLEIRLYIDIEKFSVDEKETLPISEAREIGKILVLNFRQPRGPDLSGARSFLERNVFGQSRLLQFFADGFHGNRVFRIKRQRPDRRGSRAASRLLPAPKYRAAPEYQRCGPPGCSQGANGVATTTWKRVFPVE
jgi:hypothetical protein